MMDDKLDEIAERATRGIVQNPGWSDYKIKGQVLTALDEAVAERDREWAATNSDALVQRAVAEERKALRRLISDTLPHEGAGAACLEALLVALDALEEEPKP
jgi:hypothetical protein